MVFPASSALHFNVSKLLQYFVFHPIWDSSVSLGINAKMYQITNTMEKANVTQFLMNVPVSIEGFFSTELRSEWKAMGRFEARRGLLSHTTHTTI